MPINYQVTIETQLTKADAYLENRINITSSCLRLLILCDVPVAISEWFEAAPPVPWRRFKSSWLMFLASAALLSASSVAKNCWTCAFYLRNKMYYIKLKNKQKSGYITRPLVREGRPVFPEVDFHTLLKEHHLQSSHFHKADGVIVSLYQEMKPLLLCYCHTCIYIREIFYN